MFSKKKKSMALLIDPENTYRKEDLENLIKFKSIGMVRRTCDLLFKVSFRVRWLGLALGLGV